MPVQECMLQYRYLLQEVSQIMTDIEKRAHDIACALLSKTMEDDEATIFIPDGPRSKKYDFYSIVEIYSELYEGVLAELHDTRDYD